MNLCIDYYKLEKGKIVLSGWFYSESLKVTAYSNQDKALDIYPRADINAAYHLAESYDSGFKFNISIFKVANITFTDTKETVLMHISLFHMVKRRSMHFIKKVHEKVREYGFIGCIKSILKKLKGEEQKKIYQYQDWLKKNTICEAELKSQRLHTFDYQPKISIVVPTYNTPINFLKEMVSSVVDQTYENWELCIADGASTDREIISYLKSIQDEKVNVVFLAKNLMISGNTNEALKLCTGDFITLLDHDDLLAKNALYEVVQVLNEDSTLDFIYSDEDKVDETSTRFSQPHFKPDFAIDNLRSYNYITHLAVIRKTLLDDIGYFDSNCDGAQDYDLFLRICDATKKIYHIPKILYHWRIHSQSTSADPGVKSYVLDAAKYALKNHLDRNNLAGDVVDGFFATSYKINYDIVDQPLISIIIPNKDHMEDLQRCLRSIEKSTYRNYEIIIVENNSEKDDTFAFYDSLKEKHINVVYWKGSFNFSKINNYGRTYCHGKFILLLNNDVEVINESWLSEMLMHCQRDDVGAVGAKLYYPNGQIQHAGVIIGIGSVAGHSHKYYDRNEYGYMGRLKIVHDLSAVTAACLMMKSSLYDELNGLDELFTVAFNDVDLCLRIREKGYHIVFTPYAELYHYESLSRGSEDSPEKIKRFQSEIKRFESKWGLYRYDPYYNINLTLDIEDFSLHTGAVKGGLYE